MRYDNFKKSDLEKRRRAETPRNLEPTGANSEKLRVFRKPAPSPQNSDHNFVMKYAKLPENAKLRLSV